jgi:ATP-binding cassette, subfamily B, bacterial MsbA
MNTYLRVLRFVKPYWPQILGSVFFMVIFSLLSGMSIVMMGPFLEALFSDEPAAIVQTAEVGTELVGEAAEAGDMADTALQLQESFSLQGLRDKLMLKLNSYLLRGTKMESLWRIVVVFFVLTLLKNVSGYVQFLFTNYVQYSFIRDLRDRLYARMAYLPLSFYHEHRAGELISRATNDVLVVNRSVNMSFTNISRDPLMIVLYLGFAFLLSWRLTLLAMIVLPLSLGIIMQIGKKLRKYSTRQQEKMANLTSRLQETIAGIRIVKAFTSEEVEIARFNVESRRLFHDLLKIANIGKLSSPLTEQLSVMVGLFLLWYGGRQVLANDQLPPHLFMLFLFFIFSVGRPIKALSEVNNGIQEGIAAAVRIFDVLDHPVEIVERRDATTLEAPRGDIRLRDLHFHYANGEPVLRGIDLEIARDTVVALVGSSGAGKSTLVDLIPRFYDATSGSVEIDGRDVRDFTLVSLRESIGLVTQEVLLFNETVHNNIAYGMPRARQEEVIAAAKAANAHDFIMRMPQGYETMIGDRGMKLSGGQRQRLSIARAVLKNPPILIFDEATSALDTESELLVQEAIDRLVRNRTTIVIAHRLSTIQNADCIHVMHEGRIVQSGTHEELMKEIDGHYRHLHDLQFR